MSFATPLKPFRTTAFKLAAGYLIVFGIFATGLIGYLVFETGSVVVRDVDRRLTEDARRLGREYQRGGINALFNAMQLGAQAGSNRLYALLDSEGRALINTIGELPEGIWRESGLARFAYLRVGPDGEVDESRAIVRVIDLPNGFHALIGLDIGQSDVIRQAIVRAALVSVVLLLTLALLGWFYVNTRVLTRLDSISRTTARIMDGHMSERIAVLGNGDEFDRLADQLNVMLERLERLMNGLKEVSDNIAHDLRTPLTRMRNQMEDALRQPPDNTTDRAALENALAEAERLMATFQALLTIARVEAGGRRHTLSSTDLAQVLVDVVELYAPVAEDAGLALTFDPATPPLPASVNRELVSLAIANLIDNALKYGAEAGGFVRLTLSRQGNDACISVVDNGPGIPAADLERVRGRFVRLDKSRSADGSGLGLALVEAVASFHEGTLELADAQPDQSRSGLRATLRLPLGDAAGAP